MEGLVAQPLLRLGMEDQDKERIHQGMEETFTHKASGKQYTRKADGTCWYGSLQITEQEYNKAKAQHLAMTRKKEDG